METKSTSKIARACPGIGDDEEDRISSLPDEVISHILSFMETKYAVGTAVLSRRWQDLWTRVSNFDIDNHLAYKSLDEAPQELEPRSDFLKRRYLECSRFVDKVMGQHKNLNSLCRFRFHFKAEYYGWKVLSETRFERELVFGPPIEEIDVMIRGETEFGIPQCMCRIPENFYTLKNLKVAKLSRVVLDEINDSVFLPSVKILQLQNVEMKDFESLGRIISGCPILETLHINSCHPSNMNEKDRIEVSLPCLKNLKISDNDTWDDPMCPIVIEAPNLEDLYLDLEFAGVQFKGQSSLTCLHSARVDVGVGAGEECQCSDQDLIGLLAQISNAKKMSLLGDTLGHLSVGTPVPFPDFPNLTQLMIETEGSSWVFHSLLHSASNLQSLSIRIERENSLGAMTWDQRSEPNTVPECLLSSLEEIVIHNLVPDVNHLDMVAYLLRAGAVLKKVTINLVDRDRWDVGSLKILRWLLQLSRRSSSCEARFLFPNDEEMRIESDHETDIDDTIDDDDDNSESESDSE